MEGNEQLAIIIPTLKQVGDAPPSDGTPSAVSDGDLPLRFQFAMDALLDAVECPGALQRTIDTPFGPMPGSTFARLVAFDGLIHGWDLATSTQQTWDPPEEVVTEVDAFARQAIAPEMRDGDTFAQAIEPPANATAPPRRLQRANDPATRHLGGTMSTAARQRAVHQTYPARLQNGPVSSRRSRICWF